MREIGLSDYSSKIRIAWMKFNLITLIGFY
jgi:hypothetical protein